MNNSVRFNSIDHTFFISKDEVTRLMDDAGFPYVKDVVRFLFPDYLFFKCTYGGYWGKVPFPRRGVSRLPN